MWPYQSQAEALLDANRLAQGMTYKAAVADIRHGGGKAVILGHAQTDKTADLLRAMGRFVHTLGGRYITGKTWARPWKTWSLSGKTPYVAGLPRDMGCNGDPAPLLRSVCFWGCKCVCSGPSILIAWACVLPSRDVATSPASSAHLHAAGAELIVTDVVPEKAQRLAQQYGARVVAPEEIYDVPCEVYAPCALGGTLNDNTIPRLQCQIIAGSANNQCLGDEHSDALRQRGIVYAPDFVINAGGLINIAAEREPGATTRVSWRRCGTSRARYAVCSIPRSRDISTQRAALQLAERKLAQQRLTPTAYPEPIRPAAQTLRNAMAARAIDTLEQPYYRCL